MLPLNLLRIPLAWVVLGGVEVTRVGLPIIGVIAADPKGLQQRFQLQEHFVFAPAKDIVQHPTAPVVDGMPEPPLRLFLAYKRPHLIDFCFIRTSDNDLYIAGGQSLSKGSLTLISADAFFSTR